MATPATPDLRRATPQGTLITYEVRRRCLSIAASIVALFIVFVLLMVI
ncbi:MAG: hypothetical protein QM662_11385 [Gordonia sp. (in: high G+C Gram-positive bacteria)]